jgi:hypothetical protein
MGSHFKNIHGEAQDQRRNKRKGWFLVTNHIMYIIMQGGDGIPFPLMSNGESTETGGDFHRLAEFKNVFKSMTKREIVGLYCH